MIRGDGDDLRVLPSDSRAESQAGSNGPSGSLNPSPRRDVADGLYRVVTPYLCAGFVIENGRVTRCAPILRRKLGYWMTIAQRVNA